jgi:hypothetical protein
VPPTPAGEDTHDLGHEDLPPLGHRAEPRRLHERYAVRVGALPGDVASADADPHTHPRPVAAPARRLGRLLDRDRGRDRVGRARERGHDPVAEIVVERAVVGADRLGQQPLVRLAMRLGVLLPEPHAQLGRSDEIGEENRGGAGGPFGRLGGHRCAVYFVCALRGKERCEAASDRISGPVCRPGGVAARASRARL